MKKSCNVLSISALSLISMSTLAGQLQVGAAKVNMTADLSEFPYTAHGERPYVGVHNPIFSRSAIFTDGKTKVALIVLETTVIPEQISDKIISAVSDKLNISQKNVLLTATHNHGTLLSFFHSDKPDNVMQQELDRTENAAIKSAVMANDSLENAQISYAKGEGWVNVNNGEGYGIENLYDADHHFHTSEFNPTGIPNRNLDVVNITSVDGKPITQIINYASHAEVMFRNATKDGGYEVTGDLPGAVSNLLEHSTKGAPVVIFTAAAESDQLPYLKARQLKGDFPYIDYGAAGWAILDLLARNLATSVIETQSHLSKAKGNVDIESKVDFLTCAGHKSSRNNQTEKVAYSDGPDVNIGIGTIKIGDIAFAGISGDVSTKIGNQIKNDSPVENTVVISMRSGHIGYVLSDDFYKHPNSHAAAGSKIKPGCVEHNLSKKVAQLLK
jgi:neutral ceramidase